MTENDVEKIILQGGLKSLIDHIYNELNPLISYLNKKNLYIGDGGCGLESFLLDGMESYNIRRGMDNRNIHVQDIALYIKDKDQYKALLYGVSLEHYKKYKEFKENPRICSGKTRSGKPCNGGFFKQNQFPNGPGDFDPDKKYYCGIHGNLGDFG